MAETSILKQETHICYKCGKTAEHQCIKCEKYFCDDPNHGNVTEDRCADCDEDYPF